MAPKKDLAALTTKGALSDKAVGKRKRLALTVKERDFCHMRRGLSTPKVVLPAPVEMAGEGFLDLPAMLPCYPLHSLPESLLRRNLVAHLGLPERGSEGPCSLRM